MTDTPPSIPGNGSRIAGNGLPAELMATIDGEAVPARSLPRTPASPAQVRAAGWRLDDLWLPAVVLHQDALEHNLNRFAAWCTANGVEPAPHGKTTMSPQLWSAQLATGAWGLTAATVAQARVMHACGAPRVLIANEVVEPRQIEWLAAVLAEPGFEPLCLVDSAETVELLERHLAGAPRTLPVLVELGVPGGRTGVRDRTAALALAERVAGSRRLSLAGVEGYEGALPQRRDGTAPDDAREWLARLTDLARAADEQGSFAGAEEVIITAGGSAFPDLAAEAFAAMPPLSRPARYLVRSGCYLTHDDLSYERNSPLRTGADPDPLRPALSCYARVLSCPEPGRAVLGVGKRDVAFDLDLPIARAVYRAGNRQPLEGQSLQDRVTISKLNDHHGYCDTEPGVLAIGDVLELGLSHPCTVFDKWSLIPVLDDTDQVVDAVRTIF